MVHQAWALLLGWGCLRLGAEGGGEEVGMEAGGLCCLSSRPQLCSCDSRFLTVKVNLIFLEVERKPLYEKVRIVTDIYIFNIAYISVDYMLAYETW